MVITEHCGTSWLFCPVFTTYELREVSGTVYRQLRARPWNDCRVRRVCLIESQHTLSHAFAYLGTPYISLT